MPDNFKPRVRFGKPIHDRLATVIRPIVDDDQFPGVRLQLQPLYFNNGTFYWILFIKTRYDKTYQNGSIEHGRPTEEKPMTLEFFIAEYVTYVPSPLFNRGNFFIKQFSL